VLSIAACVAAFLADGLWKKLGWVTLSVVHFLLRLCAVEAVENRATFTLGTPNFQVQIAPACAGYEGMGLILVLLVFLYWLFRRDLRFPRALVLVPLGIAIVWLLNAVRITALILIGAWGYPNVAVGGFHSQAGWLAFNAVGFLALIVIQRWSFIRVDAASLRDSAPTANKESLSTGESPQGTSQNESLPYLAPLFALVLASMIGEALGDGAMWFYPLRVPAVLIAFGMTCQAFAGGKLRPSPTLWGPIVGIGVFALWMLLEPKHPSVEAAPAVLNTAWGNFWLVCRVLGSVVCVPLAEELAFRGYLLRRLISRDFQRVDLACFKWLSFAGSSILFGLLHGRWFAGTLAGMAYAGAVYRHRRLGDAIVAHAVTNALIAAWVVMFGRWSLWQ
jgi:exosortase E/protease (VPEID-CTERM system)